MNSQDLQKLQEAYMEVYEGAAAEHPDIANQSEFQKKADEVLKQRQQRRAKKASPELPSFVKRLKNEEVELGEATYKPSQPEDKKNIVTSADRTANTKAWRQYTSGNSNYTAASHVDPNKKTPKKIVSAMDKKMNTVAWRKYKEGHPDYEASPHGLGERHMTSAERRKEEALGKRTGSAKASMMKQYGPEKGEQVYYAWKRKQAMKEDISMEEAYEYIIETIIDVDFAEDYESAENIFQYMGDEFVAAILEEYIEEKARGTRPKRTVHAYDVDETLVGHGKKGKPNVKVHVNDASGKRVKSLSNQEFNTHKLDKGHSYDFSEFRSAKKFGETSSANKKVIKDVKRKQARGQNVHIITARAKFDDPKEFQGHLKKKGVDVPINKIHYTGGMKGSDIGKKKVDVASGVAKQSGAKKIHMYDDAAKVHKAFEKEKENKPTSTTIKTHLAKPNASGETTLRSYQGAKGGRTSDNPSSTTKQTQRRRNKARKNMGEEVSSYLNIEEGNFKGEVMSHYYQETQEDFDLKNKLFISFSGTSKAKNELKEATGMTPYEQWKSFIKENEVEEFEESVEIETELKEDFTPMNSYQTWKSYLESI